MIEGDPGITNNKVVVRKTDFEVFQALDVDSIDENGIEKSNLHIYFINGLVFFLLYSF